MAYVELGAGGDATREALKAFSAEHVSERAARPAEIFILESMPLTHIGKPDKVKLRDDAAARVFTDALSPLAGMGVEVRVRIGAHASAGTLATVTLTAAAGVDRKAAVEEVRKILSAYTIAHEVIWD